MSTAAINQVKPCARSQLPLPGHINRRMRAGSALKLDTY